MADTATRPSSKLERRTHADGTHSDITVYWSAVAGGYVSGPVFTLLEASDDDLDRLGWSS